MLCPSTAPPGGVTQRGEVQHLEAEQEPEDVPRGGHPTLRERHHEHALGDDDHDHTSDSVFLVFIGPNFRDGGKWMCSMISLKESLR